MYRTSKPTKTSLAVPVPAIRIVRRQKEPKPAREMTKRLMNCYTEEEIHNTQLDTEYKIAVIAASLARHLCKHFDTLSIAVMNELIN